jgi:hypothetical protein
MSDVADKPGDQANLAEWRMTEETLPERPDDRQWPFACCRLVL